MLTSELNMTERVALCKHLCVFFVFLAAVDSSGVTAVT